MLQGGLPTISGFGKLPAVEDSTAEQELAAVVAAVPHPVVVHCCAQRAPIGLLRAAGAHAVSVDVGQVQDLDALGSAIEGGTHLLLGVIPASDAELPLAGAHCGHRVDGHVAGRQRRVGAAGRRLRSQ